MAMQYSLRWTKHAEKELDKLDANTRKRVYDYMNEVVANGNNPEDKGKPLKGRLKGFWRYRPTHDYRVVCRINDDNVEVAAVDVFHRSKGYKNLNLS